MAERHFDSQRETFLGYFRDVAAQQPYVTASTELIVRFLMSNVCDSPLSTSRAGCSVVRISNFPVCRLRVPPLACQPVLVRLAARAGLKPKLKPAGMAFILSIEEDFLTLKQGRLARGWRRN